MPASLESIRREARIVPTPRDAGLQLDVTVIAYDNGVITCNGRIMNQDDNAAEGFLAAMTQIGEYLQVLRRSAAERTAIREGESR